MAALPRITVDGTTGGTVGVPSYNARVEIWLRADARVFLGFNESAVLNQGIYVDPGEIAVVVRPRCLADLYFVAATSTYIYAETVDS